MTKRGQTSNFFQGPPLPVGFARLAKIAESEFWSALRKLYVHSVCDWLINLLSYPCCDWLYK